MGNQEKEKIGCTYGRRLNKPVKDYVSYRSPIIIADSVGVNYIYAVKSSMAQTRRLVRMHEGDTLGKETTICLLGEINSMLTGDGRNLFWSETVSGHRWAYENFSMIIRYDTWTHKKRYSATARDFLIPCLRRTEAGLPWSDTVPKVAANCIFSIPEQVSI
jgi:hypothetical protein